MKRLAVSTLAVMMILNPILSRAEGQNFCGQLKSDKEKKINAGILKSSFAVVSFGAAAGMYAYLKNQKPDPNADALDVGAAYLAIGAIAVIVGGVASGAVLTGMGIHDFVQASGMPNEDPVFYPCPKKIRKTIRMPQPFPTEDDTQSEEPEETPPPKPQTKPSKPELDESVIEEANTGFRYERMNAGYDPRTHAMGAGVTFSF